MQGVSNGLDATLFFNLNTRRAEKPKYTINERKRKSKKGEGNAQLSDIMIAQMGVTKVSSSNPLFKILPNASDLLPCYSPTKDSSKNEAAFLFSFLSLFSFPPLPRSLPDLARQNSV